MVLHYLPPLDQLESLQILEYVGNRPECHRNFRHCLPVPEKGYDEKILQGRIFFNEGQFLPAYPLDCS